MFTSRDRQVKNGSHLEKLSGHVMQSNGYRLESSQEKLFG